MNQFHNNKFNFFMKKNNLNSETVEGPKFETVEGPKFKEFRKLFANKKRIYNNLDLNKILMADVEPYLFKKTNSLKFILDRIYTILTSVIKIIVNVYLFEYVLFEKSKGSSTWFIVSPSLRDNYLEEANELSTISNPTLISWKKIKNNKNVLDRLSRIIILFKLFKISYFNKISLLQNINLAKISFIALDLFNNFKQKKPPKIIFCMKDFQRFENAIIQSANLLNIESFTTQHAVHHCLIGKNNRLGEIVFRNTVAKNILTWGKFNCDVYLNFNKKLNIIPSQAILMPKVRPIIKKNKLLKPKLLICLPGPRHKKDNYRLLELLKKIEDYIDDYELYLRIHPTQNIDMIKNVINKFGFKKYINITEKYSDISKEFSQLDTIAITGLTGTYYDLVYLGYKVISFDPQYDLYKKMPVVFEGVINEIQLKKQIDYLNILDFDKWYKKANQISFHTLGLKIRELRSTNIINEIEKYHAHNDKIKKL
jgi:hypothetical protein